MVRYPCVGYPTRQSNPGCERVGSVYGIAYRQDEEGKGARRRHAHVHRRGMAQDHDDDDKDDHQEDDGDDEEEEEGDVEERQHVGFLFRTIWC